MIVTNDVTVTMEQLNEFEPVTDDKVMYYFTISKYLFSGSNLRMLNNIMARFIEISN
jgi:hypothetical protein